MKRLLKKRKFRLLVTLALFVLAIFIFLKSYYSDESKAMRAIASRDIYGLESYLEHGGDPNLKFVDWLSSSRRSEKSLLHYAITKSNVVACELLLKSGADPNIRDYNGKTPMMLLSVTDLNDLDMAKIFELLLNKTDLTIADDSGNTILHLIAMYGKTSNYEKIALANPALDRMKNHLGRSPRDLLNLRFLEAK